MATLITNTFEGGTLGATLSVANTGGASGTAMQGITVGTSGNTITFDNAHPSNGTLGMKLVTGTVDSAYAQWALTASTRTVFRFYLYLAALPNAQTFLAQIRSSTGSMAALMLDSSNRFEMQNAPGSVVASTASTAASAGVEYRVEFAVTPGTTTSNGRIEYAIYPGDSTTPTWTYDSGAVSNTGTAAIAFIRLGRTTTGTVASTQWYDELSVQTLDTGWIGAPPVVATPAPVIAYTLGQDYAYYDGRATTNADGHTISPATGVLEPVDGFFVIPRGTTNVDYTHTATGPGGSATQTFTVLALATGGGNIKWYDATEPVIANRWK